MALPLTAAAAGSALGGLAGWRFHAFSRRLSPAVQEVEPSPRIVYGMHQGVYIGAVLGGMIAWRRLRAEAISRAQTEQEACQPPR